MLVHLMDLKIMNNSYIKKRAMIYLFLYVILVVLCLVYIYPVAFPYDLSGAYYVSINYDKIIVSVLFLCIIAYHTAIMLEKFEKKDHLSDLILIVLNLIYFIPGIVINVIYKSDEGYYWLYFIFWLMIAFYQKTIPYFKKQVKLRLKIYGLFMFVVTLLLTFISLYLAGFKINIFDVLNYSAVYEKRASFAESNVHWAIWFPIVFGSLIIPTWIVIAYENKKYWMILLMSFAMFAMYSVASNRTFLFNLIIAYAICFWGGKKDSVLKFMVISWGVICIEGMTKLSVVMTDIMRRVVLTPNIISRSYYDFFTHNEPDILRQVWDWYLIPLGVSSPYSSVIPSMIGAIYGNGSNYNTGLLGGALSSYGYFSVIISPLLYVVSFRLLDMMTDKINNKKVKLSIAIILGMSITNTNNWAESLIIPSFVLIYYISLIILPDNLIYIKKRNNDFNDNKINR